MQYLVTSIFGDKILTDTFVLGNNMVRLFRDIVFSQFGHHKIQFDCITSQQFKLGDLNFDGHRFQAICDSMYIAVMFDPVTPDMQPVVVALPQGDRVLVGVSALLDGYRSFQWQTKPWMAIQDLERLYGSSIVYSNSEAAAIYMQYLAYVKQSLDAPISA